MSTIGPQAGDFMWLKHDPIQIHKIKQIISSPNESGKLEYQCECGATGRNRSEVGKEGLEAVVASAEAYKHCAHFNLCPECFPKCP